MQKNQYQHNAVEVSERIKHFARCILLDAERKGIIQRPDICEECHTVAVVDAHHTNYYYPLEVIWLCRSCHLKLHPNHYQRTSTKLQKALDWLRDNPGNLDTPSRDIDALIGVSHMTVFKAQQIMKGLDK